MQIGVAQTMITFGMQTDNNWQKGMVEILNLDVYDFKILNGMKHQITNIDVLQSEIKDHPTSQVGLAPHYKFNSKLHWQDGMYDKHYETYITNKCQILASKFINKSYKDVSERQTNTRKNKINKSNHYEKEGNLSMNLDRSIN